MRTASGPKPGFTTTEGSGVSPRSARFPLAQLHQLLFSDRQSCARLLILVHCAPHEQRGRPPTSRGLSVASGLGPPAAALTDPLHFLFAPTLPPHLPHRSHATPQGSARKRLADRRVRVSAWSRDHNEATARVERPTPVRSASEFDIQPTAGIRAEAGRPTFAAGVLA